MLHAPRVISLGEDQELALGFTMCFTEPACQIARLRRNAPPSSGRTIEPLLTLSPEQLDALIAALSEVRDAMPRRPALRPSVARIVAQLRALRPVEEDTSHLAAMRPLGAEWAAYLRELGIPPVPALLELADVMADVYVEPGGWTLLDPDDARRRASRTHPAVAFMDSDGDLLLLDGEGRVLGLAASSTEPRPVARDLDALLIRLATRLARGEAMIPLESLIERDR